MTRAQVFQPIAHADAKSGRVPTPVVQMVVSNDTAANVPLQIAGTSSQSGHLTDWKNNSLTVLAYVDKDGAASFAGLTISGTLVLPNNSVTNAMLAQAAANTVKGNATGSTANETDISVGTNTVLGRLSGNLVAGQVQSAQIAVGAVLYANIQASGSACLLGAATGGSTFGEITLDASLEFNAGALRRAAFAGGDVTGSAGSAVLTIGTNVVTNAKAAQMAANTVKGNNTGSTANQTDISVGTNTVLGRVAGNIVAAQLVTGQITDANVTFAKFQDITGLSVFGNGTNATGVGGALTAGTDGHVLRRSSSTTLAFGTLLAGSFATGPGIVTLAMLDNANALSVTCRASNSSGARGDTAAGSDDQVFVRQSSALTWSKTLNNLDLTGTGNDLGGKSGAKGRNLPITGHTDASGSMGTTAEALNIDGRHSGAVKMKMPACKCVWVGISLEHFNGSDPGNWQFNLVNDTASTSATKAITMSQLSPNVNYITGALSSDLSFASGDRMWAYVSGPSCNGMEFRIIMIFVTTGAF